MNKTHIYAVVAMALIATVLIGGSTLFQDLGQSGVAGTEPIGNTGGISTVAEGTQQAAAVAMAVKVGQPETIKWDQTAFPSPDVKILIVRKTGVDPVSYEPIRTLAASAPNTGSIVWTPSAVELGSDIYVQVGCVASTVACSATISPSPLTVNK